MTRAVWDSLLAAARAAHARHRALAEFCAFPADLAPTGVAPHHIPPADLMCADPDLGTDPLAQAFVNAARHARWRETYKNTAIGDDFMTRFGCYCLIGAGGAFASRRMNAFVVYMPPGLHYPFHQHPAEELYLVLGGGAEFHRAGSAPQTLHPGDSVFHPGDRPHATTTHDRPLLAYVLWRNHLDTPPAWTPGQGL